MDTLRSSSGGHDSFSDPASEYDLLDTGGDEDTYDSPPPQIGNDERRMQVRAYNFWASLLADRNFPSIEDLDPESMADFGPHSVLLDFSEGSDDPRVAYLGAKLAGECDAEGVALQRLSDVPSRSLLSRITDHYMQILANQAPIGFEAEFVNQRGSTILYRGILLPYSSDDATIDFIYGVINWKELADQATAEELLLEIDQALEPAARQRFAEPAEIADWADGPGAAGAPFDNAAPFAAIADGPAFGLPGAGANFDEDLADSAEPPFDPEELGLADWLERARQQAENARQREDRTRIALYEAIGRAWDFALATAREPEEFALLLSESGLTMQDRAPMTPVVKLVFGADYDKTRLTEYAAALSHAERLGIECGALTEYLREAPGGLKGVVAEERRLRRAESGKPARETRSEPRKAIARKLRQLEPLGFDTLAPEGDEFALVMIRRGEDGAVRMVGEVPGDVALIEKAARQLLG